jgi:hypothetical protein
MFGGQTPNQMPGMSGGMMPTRGGFAQPQQNLPWGGTPGPAPGQVTSMPTRTWNGQPAQNLPWGGAPGPVPGGNTLQQIMQRGGQRGFAPPQRSFGY